MAKSKYFVLSGVVMVMILFFLGSSVTFAQGNNFGIGTPTPTTAQNSNTQSAGRIPSAKEQNELRKIVQSYIEIRYRALSVSDGEDYKHYGFGSMIARTPTAADFLRRESGKFAVEIRHAELDHLRYTNYKVFLKYNSIKVDVANQNAQISVTEGNEVIYEISAELNPDDPIVSHTGGIHHTIVLHKENGSWKIVSDTYEDDLWKMLRRAGNSTDEILRGTDNLLRTMKVTLKQNNTERATIHPSLPEDPSSHPYDRDGAVAYALRYWGVEDGVPSNPAGYNPNYFVFSGLGGDCQNFVSQALYEGGNVSMNIPSPAPPPSYYPDFYTWSGWYYLNVYQRATAWAGVNEFYDFVTQPPNSFDEGPEGIDITVSPGSSQVPADLEIGDVIQYDWKNLSTNTWDGYFDHIAIVVDIQNGIPFVAAHTDDHDRVPYTLAPEAHYRFIHIERSDGYPPVRSDMSLDTVAAGLTTANDDAGGNPGWDATYPCLTTNSDPGNNYFGRCSNGGEIISGFRFTNVQIPRGAHIKYAYVTFTTDGLYTSANPISLLIYGENSVSPQDFSTVPPANRDISGSPVVSWPVLNDTWTWRGKATTTDLKSIIEHIVGINGWGYGGNNALSLIFKNDPNYNYGPYHRRVLAVDRLSTSPDLFKFWAARLIVAYDFETVPPELQCEPVVSSVTRKTPSSSPTNASTVTFQVKFSEAVSNVNVGVFTLTTTGNLAGEAYVTDVIGSGDTYDVTVNTGIGDGTIRLDVRDNGWNNPQIVSESNPTCGLNGGFTSGQSYTIDKTPPSVSTIQRKSPNPDNTSAAAVDFRVQFSEPVRGVDEGNYTPTSQPGDFTLMTDGVSGAYITNVTHVAGNIYIVYVNTGNGNGHISLQVVNNGTITDYASNLLSAGLTSEAYTINRSAPAVQSSSPVVNSPTNASSVNFTVLFSEPVTGVDITDFSLTTSGPSGASITGVTGSGDSYVVAVDTGTGDGTIRLDIVPDGSILNIVTTPLTAGFTSGEVSIIDKAIPAAVSSSQVSANPTNASEVDFTVVFSEEVTSVDTSDFSLTATGVTGATVTNVTGSGDTYTVTVNSGSGDGTIRLDVASSNTIMDIASNPLSGGFTNGDTYTFDKTAPTVLSVTPMSANPTKDSIVLFRVTFSEPVSGVEMGEFTPSLSPDDFALTLSGISGAYIYNIYFSIDSYYVGVNTGTGSGTIRLDVLANGTISDGVLNQMSSVFTSGEPITIDKTPPTVLSVTRASANPTNTSSVNFSVTFSEAVTGVDTADFSLFTSGISGATVANVSGSGNSYTVMVNTGSGSGTIRLDAVANGSIKDGVNNSLSTGFTGGEAYIIDRIPPTVLSSVRASPNPTSAAYVNFTVTFSEAVAGVDVSDFGLTIVGLSGATVTSVSGSGTTYTVVVYTGHGTGLLRLKLSDNDSIMDIAGNPLGGPGSGNGNYLNGGTYIVFR